jgi:hypothetical protein
MVFHWFSLHNVVAPLWDNRWTCWQIVFISEKHILGTYFGEKIIIDIPDGANFGPYSPLSFDIGIAQSWKGYIYLL